jgi:hypothetical protein
MTYSLLIGLKTFGVILYFYVRACREESSQKQSGESIDCYEFVDHQQISNGNTADNTTLLFY